MINLDVSPIFDELFLSFTIDEALDVALDVCLEFTLEVTLEVTVSISSMEPTLHITSFMAALKLINSQQLGIHIMAIRVVEFSNGGYKIRKIFAMW